MSDSFQYIDMDFPPPNDDNPHDDGLTVCGPNIIHNIVRGKFDFRDGKTSIMDECLDCVDGAVVKLTGCVILGGIKGILAGNGDHPVNDAKFGHLEMEDCILIGNGRRCPEAQDGVTVSMKRCWLHNWGRRFDVRAFGAWAHKGGSIIAEDCIFTQEGTPFSLGLKNTLIDFGNHIGQAWNDRYAFRFLPGVARGLTADDGGFVRAERCYRNKSWIAIDNCRSFINANQALAVVRQIEANCRDLRPIIGMSASELFMPLAFQGH